MAFVEGPGMVSARSNVAASSLWQKYGERKSSGRQTTRAPAAAASPTRVNGAVEIVPRVRGRRHLDEADVERVAVFHAVMLQEVRLPGYPSRIALICPR